MRHLYNNEYTRNQIAQTKKYIRQAIFFLLLYVDPETCSEYPDVDVSKAFDGLLYKIGGLNELLFAPQEIVTVMSLLQSAKDEYLSENFDFQVYRKLVLDAGSEVTKIKEV